MSLVSDTDGIAAATAGGRSMELRPKAREKDVEAYIESCRTKFGCFETGGPGNDLSGKYHIGNPMLARHLGIIHIGGWFCLLLD